ncbi:MAG: hypothetical protein LBJ23_04925 [Tannerella sp.]|nr:hypothetical protein [Tannerella sp.]
MITAQTADAPTSFIRSSLYTFLIESDLDSERVNKETEKSGGDLMNLVEAFSSTERNVTADDSIPKSELILKIYNSIDMPDQFYNHNLDRRIVSYDEYVGLNLATVAPQKKSFLKQFVSSSDIKDSIPMALENFFIAEKIPTHLVGKWFNYTGETYKHPVTGTDTYYNVNLVKERGVQNASFGDTELSDFTSQGYYAIENSGMSLIPNTFVMGVRLKYTSKAELNEQIRRNIKDIAGIAKLVGIDAKKIDDIDYLISFLLDGTALAMGDGYYVQATSYLYQLVWNKEKQSAFNTYIDKPIEELIESGICELNYVGRGKSLSTIRSRKFSKLPESELVKRATVRSIDAVIAELQSENDVFKTKCKIHDIGEDGTIYAKIGLKEGLIDGDEYEVLERIINEKTGEETFKKTGSVKVDKATIWDNQFDADVEMAEDQEAGKGGASTLTATAFKGKVKDAHKGMYLQLSKKKRNRLADLLMK